MIFQVQDSVTRASVGPLVVERDRVVSSPIPFVEYPRLRGVGGVAGCVIPRLCNAERGLPLMHWIGIPAIHKRRQSLAAAAHAVSVFVLLWLDMLACGEALSVD